MSGSSVHHQNVRVIGAEERLVTFMQQANFAIGRAYRNQWPIARRKCRHDSPVDFLVGIGGAFILPKGDLVEDRRQNRPAVASLGTRFKPMR